MKMYLKKLVGIALLVSSFAVSAPAAVYGVTSGGVIADATLVSPTVSTFDIVVSDSFTVTGLSLQFSASHTFVPDLRVVLQSPALTQRVLFDQLSRPIGQTSSWFQDIVFTDSASTRIGAVIDGNPYIGNYKAQTAGGDLAGFLGENSFGTWKVIITDLSQPDSGYLYKAGDNSNVLPTASARFGIAGGTQLTLVPEPSAYASVFGFVALGVVILHRRIKKTA